MRLLIVNTESSDAISTDIFHSTEISGSTEVGESRASECLKVMTFS